MKLLTWVQTSKITNPEDAELPMVNGLDKIKILKCKVVKKIITRKDDGEVIVTNCGPVTFKKRKP